MAHSDDQHNAVLDAAWSALNALRRWTESDIEWALSIALIEGTGLSQRDAIGVVRVAVTGSSVSPPLFAVMTSLGREKTLSRIRSA